MSMLSCSNLSKVYGKKIAVDDISLSFEEHKIYGLLGKNGAGKTTLLSWLSGQNSVTKGNVTLDGEKVWENQKALNNICFSREINPVIMFGVDNRKIKKLLSIAKIILPYWDDEYAKKLVTEFKLDRSEERRVGKEC